MSVARAPISASSLLESGYWVVSMCRLSRLLSIAVTACLLAGSALAAPRHSVTVLLDFDQPHSIDSVKAMQSEAQRLLDDAGIAVDVKLRSEVSASAQFSDVLVFKMTGSCASTAAPFLFDERGPLAETYATDGEVLPFGEIHCNQVKALMRQSPSQKPLAAKAVGIALGRVLAHEAYHMLRHTSSHPKQGIARQTLSPADLSELGPLPKLSSR